MLQGNTLKVKDIFTLFVLTGGADTSKKFNQAQVFGLLMLPMEYAMSRQDGDVIAFLTKYYGKLAVE